VPEPASRLTDDDLHLFAEGSHLRLHHHLGAYLVPAEGDTSAGATFSVWAPFAQAVHVITEANEFDATADPLRPRADSGVWEGFVAGAAAGDAYRFAVTTVTGEVVEHADPMAIHTDTPPANASKLWQLSYDWGDADWMASRGDRQRREAPISIYEVHLGSWQRGEDGKRFLTYRELAPHLVAHVQRAGFTHVELLPVMEHPFYGSWGYQTSGYFAPTSRYGAPEDLMWLIDQFHQAGIGVLLDWVPSHFPDDWWALATFDGTHLYDHEDPRRGIHPDWNSAMFNYGRGEVRSFLLSSAMSWLERYHADGLRLDAVSSMLYLDYSRDEGQWIPNEHGGNEHLEAISFLQRLHDEIELHHPDVITFAEESTAWDGVTRSTEHGGLGFDHKWDLGWMHDTLDYIRTDPLHRGGKQDQLTFRSVYAASESFCLPLSHDEVSHGKGSMLAKLPGDPWQQRANLRLLLGMQFTTPGKKLVFMGTEFGVRDGWDVEGQLDWGLLHDDDHAKLLAFTAALNETYRSLPALHVGDARGDGFSWIDASDRDQSVVSFLRQAPGQDDVLVVWNLTPVRRSPYRIGVPHGGTWREVLNSDEARFGGTGATNRPVEAADVEVVGRPASVDLTLPPLGVTVLVPDGS